MKLSSKAGASEIHAFEYLLKMGSGIIGTKGEDL